MAGTLILLTALSGVSHPINTLTDADIIAYASTPYSKVESQEKREMLGIHHGTRVFVDFICVSSIHPCPNDDNFRLIHYDVETQPDCEKIGGVTRQYLVMTDPASTFKDVCIPKILDHDKSK